MDSDIQDFDNERVKPIVVQQYEHSEAGLKIKLNDMALYLLNEDDFGIKPEDFRADVHEHAIPKSEMARIFILVCAITGDHLGFQPSDRDTDPVYPIYEKAYQKLVRSERDRSLFLGIARVGQECGFLSDAQQSANH